jgi:integrase
LAAGRGTVTVRRIHAVLSSALSAAHRLELVDMNAASNIALPAERPQRRSVWEPAQVGAFLQVASGDRLGPLFEIAVFTGLRRGERMPQSVTKRFESLVERAQLPTMTFRGLRHQHASLMMAQRIDLAVVSKRLGHSSIAITNDLYGHLLRDANKRAAEAAEALVPRVSEAVVPLTVHTSHTRRARRAGTGEAPAEELLF